MELEETEDEYVYELDELGLDGYQLVQSGEEGLHIENEWDVYPIDSRESIKDSKIKSMDEDNILTLNDEQEEAIVDLIKSITNLFD